MSVRVCRVDAIPDGEARGFQVPAWAETTAGDAGRPLRVLIWRRGDRLRAYRNRCPHRGTPLDWVQDHFMDREGQHLVCATHGALFRPDDGHCVRGPCAGDRLDPVPVEVRGGDVYVG
ncbi:MAG: Rieske (2Fe-2S) protein [Myxococcota bacterium]